MFKILVVEDNTDKLRNIFKTLEAIGIPSEGIDHSIDALDAKSKLANNIYDLLMLDILIPLKKSGDIDEVGGLKLLHEILTRDKFNIPTHIVGLTANDEILHKAKKEFSDYSLVLIRYSNTDNEWQDQLSKGLKQWIQAKEKLKLISEPYNYDIAIITALEKELQAVKALSQIPWTKVELLNDSSPYYESIFARNDKSFRVVIGSAPQMGMNASAVLSMKLIYNFRPKYLFMTGIAAALNSQECGYGDVIVISECWDGGAGKINQSSDGQVHFEQVANHLRLETDMHEKMRHLKNNTSLLRNIKDKWQYGNTPNTELKIHIGSVASVAGVIQNEAVAKELTLKDRKLLGLELEAYGVYYGANNCSNPKPTVMAIKSVSDFADAHKNDLYQNYACFTSANVLYEFIMSSL